MIGKSHSSVEPALGAHHAVRRDAARVVAGDPRDQPGAHDGEERDQAAAPAEPPAQAQRASSRGEPLEDGAGRGAEPHRSGLAPRRRRVGPRRRQLAGRIVSIASSTVTMPTSRSLGVDDRDGQQVVAGDDLGDLVAVGQDVDRRPARRSSPRRSAWTAGRRSGRAATARRPAGRRRRPRRRSRSSRRRARARAAGRSSAAAVRSRRDGHELGGHRPAGGVLGIARAARRAPRPRRAPSGRAAPARVSSDRSATRSAASSGDISSRMSAARSGARSSRTSTWVSGSISSIASAAASSSRAARTPARSRGASWSMIVARSAGMQLGQAGVRDAQLDRGDARLDRVDVLPVDVALRGRQAAGCGPGSGTRPRCPSRRSSPAAPTSTATRWSLPSTSSSRRSLTRTTLRPSMSTICLSSRSSRSRNSFVALLELGDVDGRRSTGGAPDRVEPGDVRPGQEDPPPVGRARPGR